MNVVHRSGRLRLIDFGPSVALVLLIIIFEVINPGFLAGHNLTALASQLSILLVIAVGMTFVIVLGSIDLSVEGLMATASLVFVLLSANSRESIDLGWFAPLIGVLAGTMLGLLSGTLHVALRLPSFMVTLGVGAIGSGIATVLFGGSPPKLENDAMNGLGTGDWYGIPYVFFIAVVVLVIGILLQRFTRFGRYGYVIGGDQRLAMVSGINPGPYKIGAFALAGTTAGVGGVMASMQLGVGDPNIGANTLFTAISAVVVGGTLLSGGHGGLGRSLIGALIIVVLSNGLIMIGVGSQIQAAVQGVVIVIAVAITSLPLLRRVRVVK